VDVRREGTLTTFAAIHEPYEDAPRIRQIRRLVESDRIMAIVVAATQFIGYLLVAFWLPSTARNPPSKHQAVSSNGVDCRHQPTCPQLARDIRPRDADERTVAVYLQFSPEEVHFSAGREAPRSSFVRPAMGRSRAASASQRSPGSRSSRRKSPSNRWIRSAW